MGNSCCNRNNEDLMDLNINNETIKNIFEEINKSSNPFFYSTLSMIEKAEHKFLNSGKNILNYVNTEYSYIINSQLKLCYKLVKPDLDFLIENKNSIISQNIYYMLVILTLSNSNNCRSKKESICYTIVDKFLKDKITDYSNFIESIKRLASICTYISIIFVMIHLIIDDDNIELDLERLLITKKQLIFKKYKLSNSSNSQNLNNLELINGSEFNEKPNNELSSNAKSKETEITNNYNNNYEYNNKYNDYILENNEYINYNNNNYIIIRCDNLPLDFFNCIREAFPFISVYSSYDKYLDKVVNNALNKLFFRKNIFSELNKEELKTIIDDVVDIISCKNLFNIWIK